MNHMLMNHMHMDNMRVNDMTDCLPRVRVRRVRSDAKLPVRATDGSAGYDLYANLSAPVVIGPGEVRKIPVGVCIELPSSGVAGMVYARSGLSTHARISAANGVGVIDSDFRGEIAVPLQNLSDTPYTVEPDTRIAQLVFTPIYTPELQEAEALRPTQRGEQGYGSTGSAEIAER